MKTVGIILIVVAIVALAYQGVTYTTHDEVANIAGVRVTTAVHHGITLPPILGGLALTTGMILLIAGFTVTPTGHPRRRRHEPTASDRGSPTIW